MKTFILILTMMIDGGNDGQGGLATAEFVNKEKCVQAGQAWENDIKERMGWSRNNNDVFYICVAK
jgi:hypothetical protein